MADTALASRSSPPSSCPSSTRLERFPLLCGAAASFCLDFSAARGQWHRLGCARAAHCWYLPSSRKLIVLHAANACLRPVAMSIAAAEKARADRVARAIRDWLEDPRPSDAPPGLSFNPYLWASVSIFRHDNSVLANTPWLDLAIIPLGATPRLPAAAATSRARVPVNPSQGTYRVSR